MELDSDLPNRLKSLQLPLDANELENVGGSNAGDRLSLGDSDFRSPTPVQDTTAVQDTLTENNEGNKLAIPDADPSVQEIFERVLAATRVYNRVEDKEVDAVTTVSTTRSRAWSILSGLSLAEISVIAVIKLPLYEPELIRFRRLASPSPAVFHRLVNVPSEHIRSSQKRIIKDLMDLDNDPTPGISVAPIGDDIVRIKIQ